MLKRILVLLIVFALGWIGSTAYTTHLSTPLLGGSDYNLQVFTIGPEGKTKEDSSRISKLAPLFNSFVSDEAQEKPSPYDWVKEEQIKVYGDRIIISLKDAEWAAFTDTNSMDPVIDSTANAIELVPKSEEDIHVGDLVSYKSDYADGTIIHRVIRKEADETGIYFVMKGDNNPSQDPGKIRFNQIERVVVAVIY